MRLTELVVIKYEKRLQLNSYNVPETFGFTLVRWQKPTIFSRRTGIMSNHINLFESVRKDLYQYFILTTKVFELFFNNNFPILISCCFGHNIPIGFQSLIGINTMQREEK